MTTNYEPRAKSHILFAVLLFAIAFACTVAEAGEFSMSPGITMSEEYNDNIFLASTDRTSDYVSRLMPSVIVRDKTDFWTWDIHYAYDYRYYAHGTRTDDTTQSVNATNKTELIKKLFIVEINDEYSRVSLDVTRDFTNESQFLNQSDRNLFTVNPYLVLKPGASSTATLGYRYINTWYKESDAVSTMDAIGYADLTTDLTSRTTFTVGAQFTREASDLLPFDKTDAYAAMRFAYSPNGSMYLRAGNSWFDFGEGVRAAQGFWSGGISHHYSTLTAAFETSLSFIPDPERGLRREDRYAATISRSTVRTVVALSGSTSDYREPVEKNLENTTYRITGMMKHALTVRTSIALDLAAERHRDYLINTRQDLYQSGVRLERKATEHVTVALQYRFAFTYSPDPFVTDYYNNRALFEISGTF